MSSNIIRWLYGQWINLELVKKLGKTNKLFVIVLQMRTLFYRPRIKLCLTTMDHPQNLIYVTIQFLWFGHASSALADGDNALSMYLILRVCLYRIFSLAHSRPFVSDRCVWWLPSCLGCWRLSWNQSNSPGVTCWHGCRAWSLVNCLPFVPCRVCICAWLGLCLV
jgi:hypothetical protein